MTSGSLEFTVSRAANPATDAEREAILADPGFGKYFTDHMVSIDYADGRVGTTPGSSRTARSSWIRRRSCCITHRKCSRGSRPIAGRTARSCRFVPTPMPPGCARRPGGWRFPSCPTSCSSNRCASSSPSTAPGCPEPAAKRRCICGRSSSPPSRDWAYGRPSSTATWCIAFAGRRVLQGRHQPRHRLGVDGIRAGQPGRYRCGQVRRQLRRLAAGPGRSRRKRLRPGGVAGRASNAASSKRWAG